MQQIQPKSLRTVELVLQAKYKLVVENSLPVVWQEEIVARLDKLMEQLYDARLILK